MRFSLGRFSYSTSTCLSLSSSFPSTSCTPSCTLSSTTRSSWKACANPPTRRVRTPTTSPSPSHELLLRLKLYFRQSNDQKCDVINVFIDRNGHESCSPGMSTTSSTEAVGSGRTILSVRVESGLHIHKLK